MTKKRRSTSKRFWERQYYVSTIDGLEPNRINENQIVSKKDLDVSTYDKDNFYIGGKEGFKLVSINGKAIWANRFRNAKLNLLKEKIRGKS